MRLLRWLMVVVCASGSLFAAVGPQATRTVAAYGPGNQNIWTQNYNTYDENCAQTGPIPCGDPRCDPSNCQQWPYGTESEGGYFHGTWLFDMSSSGNFYTAVQQAVNDASNLPYYSPSYGEVSGGDWTCSNVSLCMMAAHLGNTGSGEQVCAQTQLYGNPAYYATITFNEDISWFVGNPGAVNGSCSVNAIAHHEMGHVLGLGHSSDTSSVMFWAPNVVNYGGDEQAALKAIYLNNYQPHQAGGGDACNQCSSACQEALSQSPSLSLDLGNECSEAGGPIPTVSYPTVNPQQVIQKPAETVDNEVATIAGIVHR